MTSARCILTYMLSDIFRYSITATRDIARRARRKNIINRSLARSPQYIRRCTRSNVCLDDTRVCTHACKSRTRVFVFRRLVRTYRYPTAEQARGVDLGMPSVRQRVRARQESCRNTRPESRIQIELVSMKIPETRKLLSGLTVKSRLMPLVPP